MVQGADFSLTRFAHWFLKTGEAEASDIEVKMMDTLLQRRALIVIGHINVFLIAATTLVMTGKQWPLAWIASELLLMVWRLASYSRADQRKTEGQPVNYVPLVLSGMLWTLSLGIGSAACVFSGNTTATILSSINIAGIFGAISSRNSATPRYCLTIMALAAAPMAVAFGLSDKTQSIIVTLEFLFLVAGIMSVSLQNFQVVRAMYRAEYVNGRLAETDSLTGLPNRAALEAKLQAGLAAIGRDPDVAAHHFSILNLDLDGFKTVNDTYGHSVGDLLLHQVAQRLSGCVRMGDHVCRVGGDEFVVLLSKADHDLTEKVAHRMLSAIGKPFSLAGSELISIGVSIGSVQVCGTEHDPSTLRNQADQAMYLAKRSGKSHYISYRDVPVDTTGTPGIASRRPAQRPLTVYKTPARKTGTD